MNTPSKAIPAFFCLAGILSLASCGAISKAGQNSLAFVHKSGAAAGSKVAELTDSIRPAGIKVVDVREKDLKKQPTGEEQALAFESKRRRSWFFGGPVDFKEPTLPTDSTEADGSLLPARSE